MLDIRISVQFHLITGRRVGALQMGSWHSGSAMAHGSVLWSLYYVKSIGRLSRITVRTINCLLKRFGVHTQEYQLEIYLSIFVYNFVRASPHVFGHFSLLKLHNWSLGNANILFRACLGPLSTEARRDFNLRMRICISPYNFFYKCLFLCWRPVRICAWCI